jgi:DNA-binding CsgD family transcriptional regulator
MNKAINRGGRNYSHYWTADEEKILIKTWEATHSVQSCADLLGLSYGKVNVKLARMKQRRIKYIDTRRLQMLSRTYTVAEIAERTKFSEEYIRRTAERNCIRLMENREFRRAEKMPLTINYRVYSILANAVMQADAEKTALVEVRYYSKNAMVYGMRCTSAEFIVYSERHPRMQHLCLGLNDVYYKQPDGGKYLMTEEEILRLSNVYKGHTTIIKTQYNDTRECEY